MVLIEPYHVGIEMKLKRYSKLKNINLSLAGGARSEAQDPVGRGTLLAGPGRQAGGQVPQADGYESRRGRRAGWGKRSGRGRGLEPGGEGRLDGEETTGALLPAGPGVRVCSYGYAYTPGDRVGVLLYASSV